MGRLSLFQSQNLILKKIKQSNLQKQSSRNFNQLKEGSQSNRSKDLSPSNKNLNMLQFQGQNSKLLQLNKGGYQQSPSDLANSTKSAQFKSSQKNLIKRLSTNRRMSMISPRNISQKQQVENAQSPQYALRRMFNLKEAKKFGPAITSTINALTHKSKNSLQSSSNESFESHDSEDLDYKNLAIINRKIEEAVNYYDNPYQKKKNQFINKYKTENNSQKTTPKHVGQKFIFNSFNNQQKLNFGTVVQKSLDIGEKAQHNTSINFDENNLESQLHEKKLQKLQRIQERTLRNQQIYDLLKDQNICVLPDQKIETWDQMPRFEIMETSF
eukprot:403358332